VTSGAAAWQSEIMKCRIGLSALLLVACGGGGADTDGGGGGVDAGGPAAVHASLSWRMRCASADCPFEDPPARTINHFNGQDGHEIICDLAFNGETRRMDLTARSASGYGFEVRGATIGPEGGRLMGSLCQIRVFDPDDVNILTSCSSSNPTADTACQISRIDIRDVDGVPTLLAQLRCAGAPEEGRPAELRDVTSATASEAAELVFTGCAGL